MKKIISLFIFLILFSTIAFAGLNDPSPFGNATTDTAWIGGTEGIINATGNITTDSYFIGNGSELNVNSSTWWNGAIDWWERWFYGSSTKLYFNETLLNNTIDDREIVSNETDLIIWQNDSERVFIKDGYPRKVNITNVLYINGINESVGIGTFDPSNKLNVIGDGNFTGALYSQNQNVCLEDGSDCFPPIWVSDTNQIFISSVYPDYMNASNILFVNGTSGRVGIGTATPFNKLNVIGVGNFTEAVYSGEVYAQNGTFLNLSSINGSFVNLYSMNGSFINLSAVNGSFTNLNSTYGNFINLTSVEGSFINLNSAHGTFINLSSVNGSFGNLSGVTLIIEEDASIGGNLTVIGDGNFTGIVYSDWFSGKINSSDVKNTPIECDPGYYMVKYNGSNNICVAAVKITGDNRMVGDYIFDGNIGIGENNPQKELEINGDMDVDIIYPHSSSTVGLKLSNDAGTTVMGVMDAGMAFGGSSSTATQDYDFYNGFGNVGTNILQLRTYLGSPIFQMMYGLNGTGGSFKYQHQVSSDGSYRLRFGENVSASGQAGTDRITLLKDGKVGIGTSVPVEQLSVHGSLLLNDTSLVQSDWTDAQIAIVDSSDTTNQFTIGFDTTTKTGVLTAGKAGTGWWPLLLNPRGGNIGIGLGILNFPTAFLHIAASTLATASLRIDNGTAPTIANYGDIWREIIPGDVFGNPPTDNLMMNVTTGAFDILSPHLSGNNIYVDSLDDFPVPNEFGEIELDSGTYIGTLSVPIVTPYSFKIKNNSIVILDKFIFIYIGGGTFLKSDDLGGGILFTNLMIAQDVVGTATFVNISSSTIFNSAIRFDNTIIGGFNSMGIIEDIDVFGMIHSNIQNVKEGLISTNVTAFGLFTNAIVAWGNNNLTMFTLNGETEIVNIIGNTFRPNVTSSIFEFDKNETFENAIIVANTFNLKDNGEIYSNNSKDGTDIYFTVSGNTNLQDSTALIEAYVQSNLETTIITTIGVPVIGVGQWQDRIERFQLQNLITYDTQTGNFAVGQIVTGTTSGAYGLIVADNDTGTTGVLTLINFNGTFQIGELITDPITGSAIYVNANGRMVYTGLEDVSLHVSSNVELIPSSGIDIKLSSYIAQNGQVINRSRGSNQISAVAGRERFVHSESIVDLKTGDYLELFLANEDTTADISLLYGNLIATKI